jgi:phosphate binding protein
MLKAECYHHEDVCKIQNTIYTRRKKKMKRNISIWLSIFVLISILLAACSSSPTATTAPEVEETEVVAEPTTEPEVEPTATMAEPTPEPTAEPTVEPTAVPTEESGIMLPEVDPATVTGDFTSAGSSTVYPLSEAIQTLFESEGYTGVHTIASVGTGGGFERFCSTGETDISNASRPIKDSEVENCQAIGRTPIGFQVGIDALAVAVSSENDFLTDVTKEELAKIFSKDAVLWSDVRPEWPQENILRFSPGTDSGTFDYFVEAVMDPVYVVDKEADKGKGEAALLEAQNLQLSEDDNVLVQGVEGSPYAIGYFGYAYFNENQGNLKAISVNGVSPTAETAEDGSYPLSRPLFIYSDAAIMKAKPQVAAFINFFLTRVNEVIQDVGYFPMSEKSLEAAKQAWLDAMK